MSDDNREHWPTLSRADITDRLVLFGVPEDKARAYDKYTAVKVWRNLEELNSRLTNCDVGALLAEMARMRVRMVLKDGDYKLVADEAVGQAWVRSVLPTLKVRKAELVEALANPPPVVPDAEYCVKCLGLVLVRADAGAVCPFFLSCPYREAS